MFAKHGFGCLLHFLSLCHDFSACMWIFCRFFIENLQLCLGFYDDHCRYGGEVNNDARGRSAGGSLSIIAQYPLIACS